MLSPTFIKAVQESASVVRNNSSPPLAVPELSPLFENRGNADET